MTPNNLGQGYVECIYPNLPRTVKYFLTFFSKISFMEHMLHREFNHKRTFFMPERPSGGGGDEPFDPWEYDRELAQILTKALLTVIGKKATTEEKETLKLFAKRLQERLETVGNSTQLLAPELRKIAAAFLCIPSAESRQDPHNLAMRFRNHDLRPY